MLDKGGKNNIIQLWCWRKEMQVPWIAEETNYFVPDKIRAQEFKGNNNNKIKA